MADRLDAVVVGSGPNGLAAAVELARAGAEVVVVEAEDTVGGGTRSRDDLTVPGLVHDVCAAVHPFGAASPFFRSLDLQRHGLRWRHPPIAVGHPVGEDGTSGILHADLDEAVAELGPDGPTWRRLMGTGTRRFDDLAEDLLGPILSVPSHPVLTAVTGLRLLPPASVTAGALSTPQARALFAGIAAHVILPLQRPLTSALGFLMTMAGHAYGWPVAEGGSQRIADALVAELEVHGGQVRTGQRIRSLRELPPARVALMDVTPRQLLAIAGDRLSGFARWSARAWRHGPAAFKLDLAVEGGIPWTDPRLRRAGTVHVGGTLQEVAHAEAQVTAGRLPQRPFVLLAQQYVADPGRSVGGVHPVWMYAHVPHAFDGDATEHILRQVERFAPGFRDRIVGSATWTPADLERHDTNYVGGDVTGGASDGLQLLARPRLKLDPYRTGVPGLFLCSSSTPPGGGVHGMAGYHAARSALRTLQA